MEMLNCYMMYEKRTLWIHLKFVGLQKSQQYLPLFGNYLHFSDTAIKQNEGGRLQPSGAAGRGLCLLSKPWSARAASCPTGTASPTSHRTIPSIPAVYFFLKALFLRLQNTQPQKSIRAIKKRHKLASSDGFEKAKPAPAGSHFHFCPLFFLKCSSTLSPTWLQTPPHTALVHRGRPER